jgi:hypothetical protein
MATPPPPYPFFTWNHKMTAQDYAALTVSIITIAGAFAAITRWLVKHYLAELKPNGGSSMNDRMTRVESRVDEIYSLLLENNKTRGGRK